MMPRYAEADNADIGTEASSGAASRQATDSFAALYWAFPTPPYRRPKVKYRTRKAFDNTGRRAHLCSDQMETKVLEALRTLSAPTVANVIELFNVRPRNQGFMSPEIQCLFPELGVMVGYSVTARFAAKQPAGHPALRYDCWKYILEIPEPRVVVMQDMDQPPGVGAFFGEVMANVHTRLGCVGLVTNGHVRDLDEVRALRFHVFAGGVCVSHAYVHLLEFGTPVEVGGLTVRSGDLLHADKHGVLVLPKEIAAEVPKAAAQVAEREQRIIAHCQSPDFSLEELQKLCES
jgi:regulator of RNase E activity RraA